ncbi:MAG: hypothetical protein AAGD25_22530 [Cyanobacteria bacterium P01_F01_bin.150]
MPSINSTSTIGFTLGETSGSLIVSGALIVSGSLTVKAVHRLKSSVNPHNHPGLKKGVALPFWQAWNERKKNVPQFNFTNVAYYFGALIIIAGMSLLMALAWEQLGGGGTLFSRPPTSASLSWLGNTYGLSGSLKFPVAY